MTPYAQAKYARDQLDQRHRAACARLMSIPGVGTGPMGLTPDHVKLSPAYREAKAETQRLFTALRTANAFIAKHHRKEARADRKARSANRIKGEPP